MRAAAILVFGLVGVCLFLFGVGATASVVRLAESDGAKKGHSSGDSSEKALEKSSEKRIPIEDVETKPSTADPEVVVVEDPETHSKSVHVNSKDGSEQHVVISQGGVRVESKTVFEDSA